MTTVTSQNLTADPSCEAPSEVLRTVVDGRPALVQRDGMAAAVEVTPLRHGLACVIYRSATPREKSKLRAPGAPEAGQPRMTRRQWRAYDAWRAAQERNGGGAA